MISHLQSSCNIKMSSAVIRKYIQTGGEPQQFPLPGFMCSAPAPLQIFLCLHSLPFDLGSKENSKGSDFFKILLLVPSKITQFCSPLCITHILWFRTTQTETSGVMPAVKHSSAVLLNIRTAIRLEEVA